MREKLRLLVRSLVRSSPEPPRDVPIRQVARYVLLQQSVIVLSVIGALALAGPALLLPRDPAPTVAGVTFLTSLSLVVGSLSLTVPVVYLLRVIRAVRSGILCTATITTLDVTGPGARQTLDSLKHGFATGTRDVHRRGVPFSETFEIDEPWIAGLAIGSQLDVLTHPIKSKSLLDLGPSTDAAIWPSVLLPNS